MIEDLWITGNRELEVWRTAPLCALVTHIVQHYHLEARLTMARMETLASLAVLREGGDQPAILEVRFQVARFCMEGMAHLAIEEQELFPHILRQANGQPMGEHGALMQPLRKLLEDEHQAEMEIFEQLRSLASQASAAGDGQGPLANLLDSFKVLEASLQRHIFLENQILFPRAL